jgi:hypothetical protein
VVLQFKMNKLGPKQSISSGVKPAGNMLTTTPSAHKDPTLAASGPSEVGTPLAARASAAGLHICFCSDEDDVRPLVAAVHSAATSTRRPHLLVFHVLVPKRLHKVYTQTARLYGSTVFNFQSSEPPRPRYVQCVSV